LLEEAFVSWESSFEGCFKGSNIEWMANNGIEERIMACTISGRFVIIGIEVVVFLH
jgi:hypothetical protein